MLDIKFLKIMENIYWINISKGNFGVRKKKMYLSSLNVYLGRSDIVFRNFVNIMGFKS